MDFPEPVAQAMDRTAKSTARAATSLETVAKTPVCAAESIVGVAESLESVAEFLVGATKPLYPAVDSHHCAVKSTAPMAKSADGVEKRPNRGAEWVDYVVKSGDSATAPRASGSYCGTGGR